MQDKTRAEALAEAYPGCATLIARLEDSDAPPFFDLYRMLGVSPQEVIRQLKEEAARDPDSVTDPHTAKMAAQVNHPDFLRYVAAKLGAL